MNQKNYIITFYSLLIITFISFSSSSYALHLTKDYPLQPENAMSPDELEQEKDNYEWAQKYAPMIARYFVSQSIYQINENQLHKYFDQKGGMDDEDPKIEYMLGAVNGLLKKYENKKDLHLELFKVFEEKADKAEQKEYERYLEQIINEFRKDKMLEVDRWIDVIGYAAKLNLPSRFMNKLHSFSESDKKGLMKAITDVLIEGRRGTFINPMNVINQVSRVLVLAHAVEKEESRQGRGFEHRKRRRENEVARALELAHAIEKEESRQGRGFEHGKRRSKNEVARALDLANVLSSKDLTLVGKHEHRGHKTFDKFNKVDRYGRKITSKEDEENEKYRKAIDEEEKGSTARALDLASAAQKNKNEDSDDNESVMAKYGSEHESSDEDFDDEV